MNKDLKFKIKELKSKGYSYNKIAEELGCSKGTISYHLGTGQIEKARSRNLLRKDKKIKQEKMHKKRLQEFSWRYKKKCGCKKCGETNPIVLQYDHIDRSSKLSSVSQMISDRWSLDKIKNEIRKCQILCGNCHLIKTAKEGNYYTFDR